MKYLTFLMAGLALIALVLSPLTAHGTQSINTSFRTWEAAAEKLGDRGELFQPTYSAGLKIADKIQVLAFGRSGNTSRTFKYRMTGVNAVYGNFAKGFSVNEKWSGTAWAAIPQVDPASRPVGNVKIKRLESGRTKVITARVFANCNISVHSPEVAPRKSCIKRDVKRFGGYLTMQAESVNSLGATSKTDLIIQSKALTYDQLVRIATGMQKVS